MRPVRVVDTTASATAPVTRRRTAAVCDLGHGDATPTRLPGSPSLNLAALVRALRGVRRAVTCATRRVAERWLSSFTRGLPDELLDTMVDRFGSAPRSITGILLEHFRGAVT
jgi:hypothetical protein